MRGNEPRPGFRLLGIALLAVAGWFALGGDGAAVACQAEGVVKPSRGCCVRRPARSCGCCVKPAAGVAEAPAGAVLQRTSAAATTSPQVRPAESSSCACRLSAPAAPGVRSPDRLSERRADGGPAAFLAAVDPSASRTATKAVRAEITAADPPRAPIYLRTAHLRF